MERRTLYKLIFLVCMMISILALLCTNNDVWILPAAIFTIAFFVIWLQETIYGFYAWNKQNKEKIRNDFQIFRDYADAFVDLFRSNGERKKK